MEQGEGGWGTQEKPGYYPSPNVKSAITHAVSAAAADPSLASLPVVDNQLDVPASVSSVVIASNITCSGWSVIIIYSGWSIIDVVCSRVAACRRA